MKKLNRLTALLLCAALLLSLIGCTADPPETTTPTTVPPTTEPAPDAAQLYAQGREVLDEAQDISLDVSITTYMNIGEDEFSEQSLQALTYRGLGSEELAIYMEESIRSSLHSEDITEEELEEEAVSYLETYSQGTVYLETMDTYYFSAPLDAETAAVRYTPVVLLDAALYGQLECEEAPEGMKLLFSQPTAAESWAMPADAQMTEASGAVTLDANGAITQMDYTISYTYGPAEYRVEVVSKPLAETAEVEVPTNTDLYIPLQEADALRMTIRAIRLLGQADAVSASGLESMFCQAAGVARNQSLQVHIHGRKESTKAKVETGIYFMDYSTRESQELDQEEKYINGRYTVTTNGGLPTSQSGISWEDIREYAFQAVLVHIVAMDFWQDVTITDMGSVYLMEFTLNENFGNTIQNSICEMLWDDPAFLYNLASKYETNDVNGYISIDKFTGLSVAGGYYYEGTHTIDGTDYALTMQYDQSLDAPSLGAYKEITDQMPEEAEPETKATPLFYHVTGENGQEMWLFGTIHLGDERTAYLPQEIRDAFEASDALALECDTEAFEEQVEEDDSLQDKVSDAYYYADGTTLESLMEEEDYKIAVQFAKATGTYNMNLPYAKPYLWSNGIDQFYLSQARNLHGDQGVEERLTQWAKELDKPIWEIESSLFQIQMITGYSNELQILMLEDSMSGTAEEYWQSVEELYELWCAGDEAALIARINDEVDTSELTEEELAEYEAQKPLIDEYNKAMSYDRNIGMLNKAIEYLESGDVVFYAVGLAHLLDSTNGLVQALRDAGYTVELVAYK